MDPEVNERFERMLGVLSGLLAPAAEHEKEHARFRERMALIEQAQRQNEERIAVLVKMMDEWIRDRRNGQGA